MEGSDSEVYMVFNIKIASRKFQAGNRKHDIINVKDLDEGKEL